MCCSRSTGLLDLPVEIRLNIWQHVYKGTALHLALVIKTGQLRGRAVDESFVALGLDVDNPSPTLYGPTSESEKPARNLLALPLVNSAFGQEALPILYQEVQFWFFLPQAICSFQQIVPARFFSRIRHIRIYSLNLESESLRKLWNDVVSKVQSIERLEHLEIVLHRDYGGLKLKVRRLARIAAEAIGDLDVRILLPSHTYEKGTHVPVSLKRYRRKYPDLKFDQAWYFR
ncbi:hypothetical protein B9Z65_6098 [Elsinoe australis]|uniref:DUF7730 domain-containing protein n=1 Tax=Elsinoe australis TaxID=40998 RepID=A0A2P8A7N4_9PEZI|nr:hypothetical protein B9Z65_6098 [Elsinoe australis]